MVAWSGGSAKLASLGIKPEVKQKFFDDKLNFTVSGFYALRNNVTVNDLQETAPGSGTFLTVSRKDGDQFVRGYEIDLNWRMTRELSLNGSWGHVYSIYKDFGAANPLAVGRRVNGVSAKLMMGSAASCMGYLFLMPLTTRSATVVAGSTSPPP